MTKWLMLIVAVLAGGGGWWLGSWSGRDALDSLAKARAEAQEAKAALGQAQGRLDKQLSQLQTQFVGDQQKLQESNSRAQAEFTRLLDSRDKRIADLSKSHTAAQGNINELAKVLANPGTSAADRQLVQGQIDALNQKLAQTAILLEGFNCSKVPVPPDLLRPMREAQP